MSESTTIEAVEYVRLSPDTALACWQLPDGSREWSWAWSVIGYGSRGAYPTRQEAEAALAQVMAARERAA